MDFSTASVLWKRRKEQMKNKHFRSIGNQEEIGRTLILGALSAAAAAEVYSLISNVTSKKKKSTAKDWRRMNIWEP